MRNLYKKIILLSSFVAFNTYAKIVIPDSYQATYDVYYENKHVGYMARTFKKHKNNEYVIESKSDVSGYYGIIPVSDQRKEVSHFYINPESGYYTSKSYRMDRSGTWLDFVMKINFDNNNNKIDFSYKDRKETKDFNKEILDNASYQVKFHQEVLNKNRKEVNYEIAYKTGFRRFNFNYLGEETLLINNKRINNYKFQQVRNNKDGSKKAVFVWFDQERNNIITRLLYLNDDGESEADIILRKYEKIK